MLIDCLSKRSNLGSCSSLVDVIQVAFEDTRASFTHYLNRKKKNEKGEANFIGIFTNYDR